MWKSIVVLGRPQITVWRMHIACWETRAINTNSEYVILIAFILQKLLHGRASMLRLFVHCLYCLQTVWRSVSVSGCTTSSDGQTVVTKSVQRLATDWTLRSLNLVKCKRLFLTQREVHTCSGTHPASYSKGTWVFTPVEAAGAWSWPLTSI
jgi:hypothetical protein